MEQSEEYGHEEDTAEIVIDRQGLLFQKMIRYQKNLTGPLLKSYNTFIEIQINKIIDNSVVYLDRNNRVRFENSIMHRPMRTIGNTSIILTPQYARLNDLTYAGEINIHLVYERKEGDEWKILSKENIPLTKMPVMLRSNSCHMLGKTDADLIRMGEDPRDPGGYFIINGTERSFLYQEKLRTGRLFLVKISDIMGVVVRLIVPTPRNSTMVELFVSKKKNIFKMFMPSIRKKNDKKTQGALKKRSGINVLSLFSYFGITDLDEIREKIALFLKPETARRSLLELNSTIIDFLQFEDNMAYLKGKMPETIRREGQDIKLSDEEKEDRIETMMREELFPHMNDLDLENKVYMFSLMIAMMCEYRAGLRSLDNRDSWSNKQIETPGRLIEQLFKNLWNSLIARIQEGVTRGEIRNYEAVRLKIRSQSSPTMSETVIESFRGNVWGIKDKKAAKGLQKENAVQILKRDSLVATLSHLMRDDVETSRNDKNPNIRMVQTTQFGFICAAHTPEGESCGITKHLAVTTDVSIEHDDKIILAELQDNGFISVVKDTGEDTFDTVLLVNGKFIGWVKGEPTRRFTIEMRRRRLFPLDMEVVMNLEQSMLYIYTDPSRPVRPLLIVEDNRLLIDEKGLWDAPIEVLLQQKCIEYISPWEQEYIKLASVPERLRELTDELESAETEYAELLRTYDEKGESLRETDIDEQVVRFNQERIQRIKEIEPYTHCEIDPQTVLGVAASIIPFADRIQAPRVLFQCSMGSQALGSYHLNHVNRFDGKMKILVYPQRPLFEPQINKIIGLNDNPAGGMAVIAFMNSPYNQEDAFLVNRAALDRGFFRMFKYLQYQTELKADTVITEVLARPEIKVGQREEIYRHINENGLPMIGAHLKPGDCIIGKIQINNESKLRQNASVFMAVGEEGIVEKVMLTTGQIVRVKLRTMRIPILGDKLASRYAQKGTIGRIVEPEDMFYTENGITPDIIVNPLCIPSRMTGSYLLELLSGKHDAMKGRRTNATSFRKFDITGTMAELEKYGFDPSGEEFLFSGETGKRLEAMIYIGPCYFQMLRHHTLDKYQARRTGTIDPITHQPVRGRGRQGGLRSTGLCGG